MRKIDILRARTQKFDFSYYRKASSVSSTLAQNVKSNYIIRRRGEMMKRTLKVFLWRRRKKNQLVPLLWRRMKSWSAGLTRMERQVRQHRQDDDDEKIDRQSRELLYPFVSSSSLESVALDMMPAHHSSSGWQVEIERIESWAHTSSGTHARGWDPSPSHLRSI